MSTSIYSYNLVDKLSDRLQIEPIYVEELSDSSLNIAPEDATKSGWGGFTPTSFKRGEGGRELTLEERAHLSVVNKLRWGKWREINPDYKSKWKQNNYQKVGYAKVSKVGKKNCESNNYKLLTCPHCGKEANVGNSKRWHFDNCGKIKPFQRGEDGRFNSSARKG
jgi:hypothetical protein